MVSKDRSSDLPSLIPWVENGKGTILEGTAVNGIPIPVVGPMLSFPKL